MAPVPAEVLKSLLVQLSPGVADTDVIDGHDMSAEELAKAFAKADVVLGDYTFKRRSSPSSEGSGGAVRRRVQSPGDAAQIQ